MIHEFFFFEIYVEMRYMYLWEFFLNKTMLLYEIYVALRSYVHTRKGMSWTCLPVLVVKKKEKEKFCRMSQFTSSRRQIYFEKIEGKLALQIVKNGKFQAKTLEDFVMKLEISSEGIVKWEMDPIWCAKRLLESKFICNTKKID